MAEPTNALTPDRFRRIRRIFEDAVDLPAAERRAFLDDVCGPDLALVSAVEDMLAADARTHALVDAACTPVRAASPATCPSCKASLGGSHKFCPECGSPLAGDGAEGRFRAGALFANRFRIVAALGRGGMGEVYRAHDLELGQPVALKFLTALRSDERARQRLRNEVRVARQLAHPNVCRVYDIGEAHGELYLSMEYVDGEDLAALLKRIGRLPVDKGIEIARKLCAGLAAAHAKGVLHRDFKPANIMIDAGGEVRIMDFGLAAVANELDAKDIRSGTPAYMAPEQLAGREATVQSDLYALGLVLYELFTGKAAFDARDPSELQRQRESRPVTTPATLIPELGPRVELVVLDCLEPDPKMRPSSALDVSRALPGGDPLAEALAAGETPSPEMVAASGPTEGLRPVHAAILLVLVLGGLGVILAMTARGQLVTRLPLDLSPDVLVSKAQEMLRSLGHTAKAIDTASGFRYDDTYVPYLRRQLTRGGTVGRSTWDDALAAGPSPVVFWYQQSSDPLDYSYLQGPLRLSAVAARAVRLQPATLIELDSAGRLVRYESSERRPQPGASPDWTAILRFAGLDESQFERTTSASSTHNVAAAEAWTGVYPGSLRLPVRVEAETVGGHVSRLQVLFPWLRDDGRSSADRSLQLRVNSPALLGVNLVLVAAAAFVARRNWRMGRADASGAWRLGVTSALCMLTFFLLGAHDPVREFPALVSPAVTAGVISATVYLALEPFVRRLWPQMMVTWSRVVIGHWRDPLVARDILLGVTAATINHVVQRSLIAGATAMGAAPLGPIDVDGQFGFVLENLGGQLMTVSVMGYALWRAITAAVGFFFLLLVLRMLLRRTSLAALALFVCLGGLYSVPWFATGDVMTGVLWLVEASFLLTVMLRWGFFVAVAFVFPSILINFCVLTPAVGAWYGQSSAMACAVIVAMAMWAYWTSIRHPAPVHAVARNR